MVILHVLFYIFAAVTFVQLFYYGFIFSNVKQKKHTSTPSQTLPVSVIVCAKNEAKNLTQFLPYILDQDYPEFEVVLINDSSNDSTLRVMEKFKASYSNIKIVNVKNIEAFWGNKKYALTLGIKAATHNRLLFTDADCQPVSRRWISEMTNHLDAQHQLVLGYGAYAKVKNSVLNKLIRYETFMTAVQYFSYAKLGNPYMGVGRNMAYTKELFFEARGFMDHMNVKSGDDDLFVNQIGNSKNTTMCLSKDSFTESIPKKTYGDWIIQKRRHVSTAKHYKLKHKAALGLFFISQLLFFILGLILISTAFYWQIVVGLIAARYLAFFINLTLVAKKLNEKDLIPLFPLLEIFLIVTQFSIFIKNLVSRPSRWK
ncbi:cellulose synthase/poly-beta-1,6-N-acetylglucosamine synthase-like glycosyltransferase [Gelidibacter sediminis]|uniref:Cellulose synthase/poly-beta-1,6-N-acetylglucosamine synthase-like glycosyltransferase n=1 Tax=Gelidibacter sediminis TaxID=1608710 RepID=A0A4R7Q5H0_9FLAO|nr:glycosyltransferase [Gelidibacter sediminis]TDU42803.1 cellulose synthase/poly-beta-1,6-N-acetylglucosamine synthase-like glycosyltransferase [Gelidibacter sediminis]